MTAFRNVAIKAVERGIARVEPLLVIDTLQMVRQAKHVQFGHIAGVVMRGDRQLRAVGVAGVGVQVSEEDPKWVRRRYSRHQRESNSGGLVQHGFRRTCVATRQS